MFYKTYLFKTYFLKIKFHVNPKNVSLKNNFFLDLNFCFEKIFSLNYRLPELVRDGENGILFETSQELADQLIEWFRDFPNDQDKHSKFRKNIEKNFQNLRWHENWVLNAQPVFEFNFIDTQKS